MISVDQAKSQTGEPRSKERGILAQPGAQLLTLSTGQACRAPAATAGGSALENK